MELTNITTENTVFVALSFEGPDVYSSAGGLGVRVTNLSEALAQSGFPTHLFFIGDPKRKGEEISRDGKLVLHRWCQWISRYHPAGVYQAEEQKLYDYNNSIPGFLLEHVIKPAIRQNKIVVILAEEWHTAEVVCRISDLLKQHGVRDKVVIFWNANNTFGFERINFKRLADSATMTTVSRFMKHIMWRLGLNPLVIPNGIPKSLLNRVDTAAALCLRKALGSQVILAKIARWDPDKRWLMAVEATAMLKAKGLRTILLARGGIEPHGGEVLQHARSLRLSVKDTGNHVTSADECIRAITSCADADVINIRFHCTQEFLRIVYNAADAVLANSGKEPFGLVGLETMAAGGVAFTGSTGEDYAIPFHNSIVLETSDPKEIEGHIINLMRDPVNAEKIRKAARSTAARFTWEQIIENLTQKLEYQARIEGCLSLPTASESLLVDTSEEPDFAIAENG
ncbi:MAG: glycosyltransferase [Dehalococcoidia bacterium]|nr:glycosyltransferase [Dehalococcoidia bacterium]